MANEDKERIFVDLWLKEASKWRKGVRGVTGGSEELSPLNLKVYPHRFNGVRGLVARESIDVR